MRKWIIGTGCSCEAVLIEWWIPWCVVHCSLCYLEMEKQMSTKIASLVSAAFRRIAYSSSYMQVQGHKYKRCGSGFVFWVNILNKALNALSEVLPLCFAYSGLDPLQKNLVQEHISWIPFQRKTSVFTDAVSQVHKLRILTMLGAVTDTAGESFLNPLHLELSVVLWLLREVTFHLGVTKKMTSLFRLQTLCTF